MLLNSLPKTSTMRGGDYISSPNGVFFFVLRANGNIEVLQGGDFAGSSKSLWQSNSKLVSSGFRLILEGDGNLNLTDENMKSVWNSNVHIKNVPSFEFTNVVKKTTLSTGGSDIGIFAALEHQTVKAGPSSFLLDFKLVRETTGKIR